MCSDVIFPRDSSHNQTTHRSTCSPNRTGASVLDELAVDQRNNGSVIINATATSITKQMLCLGNRIFC